MIKKIKAHLEEYNINTKKIKDNNELVNLYFGTMVSQSIDYWLKKGSDFIENKEPLETYQYLEENIKNMYKEQMEILSKLDNKTKNVIKNLIKISMEGALFTLFAEMDQSEYGNWEIKFNIYNGKKNGVVNNNLDLHEDFHKWQYLFSENYEK